jgi:hypothetical protein
VRAGGDARQAVHDLVDVLLDVVVAHHGELPLRLGRRLAAHLCVLPDGEEVDGGRRSGGSQADAHDGGARDGAEATTTQTVDHDRDPLETDDGAFLSKGVPWFARGGAAGRARKSRIQMEVAAQRIGPRV